jgi:nucleoside-diphosphate-sugar epimerase
LEYFLENSDMKNALITGVGGQDGSILAELLLQRGYNVYFRLCGDPSKIKALNREPNKNLTGIIEVMIDEVRGGVKRK